MARNKGTKFWSNIVGIFDGKVLDDADCEFVDRLVDQVKTEPDKRILNYFETLITNDEQRESYFKYDMANYVNGAYKGWSDTDILQGLK